MYKLLTTTAVILAVASPSFAWDGAKELTQNLQGIYNNLDGQTQFGLLESDSTIVDTKNGQLDGFFQAVDQGVTYIGLEVNSVTNEITPTIHEGKSFTEIEAEANDLINRVNYDLFVAVDTTGDGYDSGQNYGLLRHQGIDVNGNTTDGTDKTQGNVNPTDPNENHYDNQNKNGLLGVKITELVTDVNTVNDYLIGNTIDAAGRTAFLADWAAKDGTTAGVREIDGKVGSSITANIFNTIDELNEANRLGKDAAGNFFGATGLEDFNANSLNDFAIPAYNNFQDIGAAGLGGYKSISNWANDIQTVTVGDKTGTVNTAGTITVVDATAGSESISDGTDTFTWDADSNSFTK